MTAEAINLIHELATPQSALDYLQKHGGNIPSEAFEHFIDFHLERRSTLLRHYRAGAWLWVHDGLKRQAEKWSHELPIGINEHTLTRIEIEEQSAKICALRLLTNAAWQHFQQSN